MAFKLLIQNLDSRCVLVGTPDTKGAGITYTQDKCPIMNQHPLLLALGRDRALVLGELTKIAKTHLEFTCCYIIF